MPVIGHRFIRCRDLNPVPALLEEAVHRPLRVKYGPVDPHVAGYPFSDLLAGRFAFTLTEFPELVEDRDEAVWEIESSIVASSRPLPFLLEIFTQHLSLHSAIAVCYSRSQYSRGRGISIPLEIKVYIGVITFFASHLIYQPSISASYLCGSTWIEWSCW